MKRHICFYFFLSAFLLCFCVLSHSQAHASTQSTAHGQVITGNFSVTLHNLGQRQMPSTVLLSRNDEQRAMVAQAYPKGEVSNAHHIVTLVGKDAKGAKAVVVVDAGYDRSVPQVRAALKTLGLTPNDVTHVILTHPHGDHMGGLAHDGVRIFPNASLLISADGYAFWGNTTNRSAVPARTSIVFDQWPLRVMPYEGHIVTVQGEAEILPGLFLIPLPGHSPGQVGVLVKGKDSSENALFFWADLMHAAKAQLLDPSIAATYDLDPRKAEQTRKSILHRAKDEGWLVNGSHMPDSVWRMVP